MKRLGIAIILTFVLSGGLSGWTNPETGIMELYTGEVRLNEIYSAAGVVVGPDCTLIVEGNVNAGAMFISRGGAIHITGKLTADIVYFDSSEGELEVEIGNVTAKYYTQCGGKVKIDGNIVARSNGDDDGRGIVNVNSEFAGYNSTRLTVTGGVFARCGDLRIGGLPFADEASRTSFFAVRGITVRGYDFRSTDGRSPYVNARRGLNATDGGTLYRDYT